MQIMASLYRTAQEKNCSFAQAASETFQVDQHQVTVIFLDRNYDFTKQKDKMISTDQIKEVLDKYPINTPNQDLIVILPFKLSPQAKKETLKSTAEIVTFEDLVYDIPRHKLYMPHELVTVNEFNECTGFRQRPQDLPRLLTTDAVSRWFGFKVGSIVKIHRPEGYVFRYVS
jgi:DNA-directed RNA polymerase subunit H (RpoH/RPB5)